jgi:hypothetical protein
MPALRPKLEYFSFSHGYRMSLLMHFSHFFCQACFPFVCCFSGYPRRAHLKNKEKRDEKRNRVPLIQSLIRVYVLVYVHSPLFWVLVFGRTSVEYVCVSFPSIPSQMKLKMYVSLSVYIFFGRTSVECGCASFPSIPFQMKLKMYVSVSVYIFVRAWVLELCAHLNFVARLCARVLGPCALTCPGTYSSPNSLSPVALGHFDDSSSKQRGRSLSRLPRKYFTCKPIPLHAWKVRQSHMHKFRKLTSTVVELSWWRDP